MDRMVGVTRYIVLLGVISSLLLATMQFVSTLIRTFTLIAETIPNITEQKAVKSLAIASIELADTLLIGTALAIVGIGLYELFIGPVNLPKWLVIKTIDDLKDKLISVVVVVLAVNFLAEVSAPDPQANVLALGAGIAMVILALTAFGALRLFKKADKDDTSSE